MNATMLLAIAMMAMSVAYGVNVGSRKGQRFEYLNALLIGELGILAFATQVVPEGDLQLLILSVFSLAVVVTAVQLIRSVSAHRRKESGGNSNSG